MEVRYYLLMCAIWHLQCRSPWFDSFKIVRWKQQKAKGLSIYGLLQQLVAICWRTWPHIGSARISFTASILSRYSFLPCVSDLRTFFL